MCRDHAKYNRQIGQIGATADCVIAITNELRINESDFDYIFI